MFTHANAYAKVYNRNFGARILENPGIEPLVFKHARQENWMFFDSYRDCQITNE